MPPSAIDSAAAVHLAKEISSDRFAAYIQNVARLTITIECAKRAKGRGPNP